jgi:Holliday junction resolvase
MTPEARVKTQVKRLLVERGVYYFMPAANGYGRSGIPDIVCCHYGHFLAIECKAGKGKTTALQDRELKLIHDAGGWSMVVTDDPVTLEALDMVLTNMENA